MKQKLQTLIHNALVAYNTKNSDAIKIPAQIQIERTRSKEFGDYACNIAMILAKNIAAKPKELAQEIISLIPQNPWIQQVKIAGPGFINFYLSPDCYFSVIPEILSAREKYGLVQQQHPKKINIEFVSSNPTGPLHVGHGRSAAYGSALANLLEAIGHEVCREYYVNDAGRQMDILAVSLWLRYLELYKADFTFPSAGYKGLYIHDIAVLLKEKQGDSLIRPASAIFNNIIPLDDTDDNKGDKEAYIDVLITRTKQLLGESLYNELFNFAYTHILKNIQDDLLQFNVAYQEWFSEKSLATSGLLSRAFEKLKQSGHTYEQDGALWFRSTQFGDDKDRVLIRENGMTTYFASDLAYFLSKNERGFEELIYIVGADHHGYLARLKAGAQVLGINPERVKILLVQFATLYRGTERLQMSTRSGSFVTLHDLYDEVGVDAARFFYVMRKCEQHMDFDLELAKSHSRHNPVYYLQYAHARICSVFQQLSDRNERYNSEVGLKHLPLLTSSHEQTLLHSLMRYPEVLLQASADCEPHQLVTYLIELSQEFHSFYNDTTILVAEENLRQPRLCLIDAVRQVIRNGFKILGISTPERLQWTTES